MSSILCVYRGGMGEEVLLEFPFHAFHVPQWVFQDQGGVWREVESHSGDHVLTHYRLHQVETHPLAQAMMRRQFHENKRKAGDAT